MKGWTPSVTAGWRIEMPQGSQLELAERAFPDGGGNLAIRYQKSEGTGTTRSELEKTEALLN